MPQPRKDRQAAIEALLTQQSLSAAATVAGVDRKTLGRWMKDDSFRRQLREAKGAAFDHAMGRLAKASGSAVTLLILGLQGQELNGKPITRLQITCAKAILEYAAAAQAGDIEERLSQLAELIQKTGSLL